MFSPHTCVYRYRYRYKRETLNLNIRGTSLYCDSFLLSVYMIFFLVLLMHSSRMSVFNILDLCSSIYTHLILFPHFSQKVAWTHFYINTGQTISKVKFLSTLESFSLKHQNTHKKNCYPHFSTRAF